MPLPSKRFCFVLVTLGLGRLFAPASPLRGQNAAHAYGVRLFFACRGSIGVGRPTLALSA